VALPRGFAPLIAAQFCSALADNALLIVGVALLVERGLPGWWAPLLKFSFTIAYVVLAPFVGAWADAVRKARVMLAMNTLKVVGVLALLLGLHPLLALAVVGIGAAAYAPAKYGLVTELVPPAGLVAANGWIEVSTVCAAVFGVVLGGVFVTPLFLAAAQALWPYGASAGLLPLLLLYALAALLNLGIPDSGARYPNNRVALAPMLRDFAAAQRTLWSDRDGALSMGVTTLFWGAAAVLQFAVLHWAAERLQLTLDRAAWLQGVVALGIVAGAAWAGRVFTLQGARRALPLGMAMGLAVPLAAQAGSVASAMALMAIVGALGGALVVPLNALLQHRGHTLLSAGRSIAVQGFNENLSVLVMLALYAALLAAGVPVQSLMVGLGLVVGGGVAVLTWRDSWVRAHPSPRPPRQA
jgi:LPLT family lysophospholipid transporter-like MFS transporter